MVFEDKNEQIKSESKYGVHYVLAHSYSFFFLTFLFAVVLDFFFPIRIFNDQAARPVGFLFLVIASFLILWAQKTGRDLAKIENISAESFCHGPYCYTRTPTHWGLFFLMLGFGIISNAFFVVLFTTISFLVSKFLFLKKGEAILEKKYGAPYSEYKKLVRF